MSTIGSFEATPEVQEQTQEQAPVNVETTQTVETEQVSTEQTQTTVDTATTTEEHQDNEVSITMPTFTTVNTEETVKEEVEEIDLEKVLAKVSKEELYKKLELDDFALKLNEHIKNGGDPEDFLTAKAKNWDKVSDIDIIKDEFAKKYPTMSNEDIERLVNKKYGLIGDEDEDADALLLLKADAYDARERKKQEQSKFEIAKSSNRYQGDSEQEKAYQEQLKLQQQQAELQLKMIDEDPATKSLLEGKRVSVSLGDAGTFNFKVDNPAIIMQAIKDPETWNRLISKNPQEADPTKLQIDVPKVQRMILAALNPNYEKDIYSYGESAGLKKVIAEGQNAQKGVQQVSASNTDESLKTVWKGAKNSTIGNLQRN